jgi:hypothetical protein
LLHMYPAPDESFGLLTCESGQFRRASSP